MAELPNDTPTVTKAPKKPSPKNFGRKSSAQFNYYKPLANKATSTQANRTILLAVGVGVGVVLIARVAGTPGVARLNNPGQLVKIGVGTGATVITLMVVAEVAPDVAIGLAWLICIGALLTYGVDFARALSKGTLNPGIPLTSIGDAPLAKGFGKVAPGTVKPL
jgi:ABC-type spermidine/putrescine transport system permease subunit II